MDSGVRIVVTGLAVTYPYGGVFWDYLQYPLGLLRLGHEVLYLEDTGSWCYSPAAQTMVPGGADNAERFGSNLSRLGAGAALRWFYRDAEGRTFGMAAAAVAGFCRSADLLVNLSAAAWLRDDYLAPRRRAFVDTDPMYTQVAMLTPERGEPPEAREAWWKALHHHFFTFGENVGRAGCGVPPGPYAWIPTRQPIVLDAVEAAAVPLERRRRVLTTVASWEPHDRALVWGGVRYRGKSAELERFAGMPSRSALPLEIALSGLAPREGLAAAGWRLRDPLEVSGDPWRYLAYLASSLGEFSVAKNAYAATGSGWFSGRTACYLALGVPAVVQDTGFGSVIPTGEGLFAFRTGDEAAAAIEAVATDPRRHGAAAREIARSHFDSDRVLARLVEEAMR